MLPAAFLAEFTTTSSFSASGWRWAIFALAICAILWTIGLVAAGVFLFRKQTTDRTLLYFSLFAVLYAVRIFLREPALVAVFGIPPEIADHVIRAITFTIALPTLFLFLEMVQTRWRRVIWWILGVTLAFAAIAIPLDLLGIGRREIDIANSVLVLGSWILLINFLFVLRPPGRLPGELRVVAAGLSVFGLFVAHANLVGLGLIPGRDVEPIGFLAFVGSLGYLVARRTFEKEESLSAIQKELEIAEQIQTSILPREVPRLEGLEIAARYRPMSAVAGDFYDFLALDGKRVGILIADVTGHGVPAALIASMLKVAFAVQRAQAERPELVLAGLNDALCGKFEAHFVTAAYVYVDLEAKIVRYAGAGHPPILLLSRAGGKTRSLEKNGYFLGMFPGAEYSSLELPLRAGDRYVLYTDGLTESKNAAEEEFGLERCRKSLEAHGALTAEKFADELLGEIDRWSARAAGRVQEDDVTLLVMDCRE